MNEIDEKLTQFIEFTGCSVNEAREILEQSNWDVTKATNFFFGIDAEDQPNLNPRPPVQPVSPSNKLKDPSPKITKTTPQIYKQVKSPPHIENKEPKEKPEKLILSGTHEKFNVFRLEAKDKNRWLLVLLTSKPLITSVLKSVELRDFINTRYVPLEISREESDGQWFSNAYDVKNYPFYAIIDPATTELFDKHEGEMTSLERQIFLRDFLDKHPEKGRSIDLEVTDLYKFTLDSSSDKSSTNSESDNEENKDDNVTDKENENNDPGPIVKVMIQMSNNKRAKIDIGENETIKILYKKVSSLIKKSVESFKLIVPYTTAEINDISNTISEMKIKKSLVSVVVFI